MSTFRFLKVSMCRKKCGSLKRHLDRMWFVQLLPSSLFRHVLHLHSVYLFLFATPTELVTLPPMKHMFAF